MQIYHRQIFKQLLSIKVLEDPRQRRLFRTSDLTELLSLNEPIGNDQTESEKLFCHSKLPLDNTRPSFSSEKVQAMRKLAACLSKSICVKTKDSSKEIIGEKEGPCTSDGGAVTNGEAGETLGDRDNRDSTTILEKSPEEISNTAADNGHLAIETVGDQEFSLEEIDRCSTNTEVKLKSDVPEQPHKPITLEEESNPRMKIGHDPLMKINSSQMTDDKSRGHGAKRKSKHSRRKMDRGISSLFEGERISCLIGRRLGNSNVQESPPTDDNYVLQKLFAKSSEFISFLIIDQMISLNYENYFFSFRSSGEHSFPTRKYLVGRAPRRFKPYAAPSPQGRRGEYGPVAPVTKMVPEAYMEQDL